MASGGEADEVFHSGQVIKLYGIYRCSCGAEEFFGVSGRLFPRTQCDSNAWTLLHRAREEIFF